MSFDPKAYMVAYREKNRGAIRKSMQRYYTANRDAILLKLRNRSREEKDAACERVKAYYHRNKHRLYTPKKREYHKKWSAKHRTALRAYSATYRAAHRENFKSYNKKWTDKNKVRCSLKAAEWRARVGRDYWKNYYRKNHEKMKALGVRGQARRRARIAGSRQDGTAEAFYKFVRGKKSIPCYYCGVEVSGKDAHIDHVIAVSKQGNHSSENLCASCPTCNLRKNDKLPSEIHFLPQPLLNL